MLIHEAILWLMNKVKVIKQTENVNDKHGKRDQ